MLARVFLVALLWSIPCQVGAQEADPDPGLVTLPGLRVGSPEKVAAGAMLVRQIRGGEGASSVTGVGGYAELGLSGARAGLGGIILRRPSGRPCSTTGPRCTGFQIRAGLLWTWGNPWTLEGGQTFAGGEVRINRFPWLVLSPGFYWRLNGTGGVSEAFLFSVGVLL
jgi:hypothetical protein